jgi:hypothetical protein
MRDIDTKTHKNECVSRCLWWFYGWLVVFCEEGVTVVTDLFFTVTLTVTRFLLPYMISHPISFYFFMVRCDSVTDKSQVTTGGG